MESFWNRAREVIPEELPAYLVPENLEYIKLSKRIFWLSQINIVLQTTALQSQQAKQTSTTRAGNYGLSFWIWNQ